MKRLLMLIWMTGGLGCAVDTAPAPASTADDPAEVSVPADPSSAEAADSPHLVTNCGDRGACTLVSACLAAGGRIGPPCLANATCCSFPGD